MQLKVTVIDIVLLE